METTIAIISLVVTVTKVGFDIWTKLEERKEKKEKERRQAEKRRSRKKRPSSALNNLLFFIAVGVLAYTLISGARVERDSWQFTAAVTCVFVNIIRIAVDYVRITGGQITPREHLTSLAISINIVGACLVLAIR